jgi:WD40 repeat protein
VAAHERIVLYDTQTRQSIGMLDFAEGIANVLRFSRDGRVLLAAGGRPVQAGKAVLYDVKTGRRLAAFGDEVDSVLACDLSADQQQVALGGSGKVVKVYGTRDGQLLYKITKHTDWITALAYSPDGARLATADRNGGVHIWDAQNGGILLSLAEHKDSVGALDWRPDGQALATGGEDGKLILWDAADGWPVATLPAPHAPRPPPGHYGKLPSGLLSLAFGPDGRFVTAGRDRWVRLWTVAAAQAASFEIVGSLPTKVAISHDGQTIVIGDSAGEVRFQDVAKKP